MPFQLITPQHHKRIAAILDEISTADISAIAKDLAELIEQIRSDIPEKKRISTGRYSIVKDLAKVIHPLLEGTGGKTGKFAPGLFNQTGTDAFVRSLGIGLIAHQALDETGIEPAQLYFETGAADDDWIVRECSSGLVRKLIKAYPEESKIWYLGLVKSPDPNQRRFVSESLRPVVENRWFHKEPNYALGVIKHLFRESAPYPRSSVGNNLSDWMRVNEDITWPIMEDLARNGDKNSYWIAYRACRNIVKKEPLKVMDLLEIDEYKYKSRIHRTSDG